ncbi:MAG TPA: DUF6602 domain-containing protein [Nostocaceae cyanobacterium]|nr:DUF6602 domain-containing protein [Nostocaceae cyanobacterium]
MTINNLDELKDYHTGNEYIAGRLKGIQIMLMAAHEASKLAANDTKGKERESFVKLFLSKTLPSQFRFGSGEITDLNSNLSGQVDIVIEYPYLPSITIPESSADTRLYLAEGVAAAIEVKSNLCNQWGQVVDTSKKIKQLRRIFSYKTGIAPDKIPLFAVGYEGWKDVNTIRKYVNKETVDGIFIIENGLFVWDDRILQGDQIYGYGTEHWALWDFIRVLNRLATSLKTTNVDLAWYARPDLMIIKKLCLEVNDNISTEIKFYDFLKREGIEEIEEVKRITDSLIKESFIEIIHSVINQNGEINPDATIKVTAKAVEEMEYTNIPI